MPECVPCNACPAPPAPSGGPCPCRTCCCGKPPKVNPCYKQPRIPDSYAPRRCYVKPTAPVEGCTTYKMSYLPTADSKNLRGVPRKPAPNLVPSCAPMEGCTVQKLSFLPNPVCVTQPIRPCHHDMWGQGPMQAITTQRHDYVPKPSVLRESCKPPPKFHSVEQPFESKSSKKQVLSRKDLKPIVETPSKVDLVKKLPSESQVLSSKKLVPFASAQDETNNSSQSQVLLSGTGNMVIFMPSNDERKPNLSLDSKPNSKKLFLKSKGVPPFAIDPPDKSDLGKKAPIESQTVTNKGQLPVTSSQFGSQVGSVKKPFEGYRPPMRGSFINKGTLNLFTNSQSTSNDKQSQKTFKGKPPPYRRQFSKSKGVIPPFAIDPINNSDSAKNNCDVACECRKS